jgi:hypothetical protein
MWQSMTTQSLLSHVKAAAVHAGITLPRTYIDMCREWNLFCETSKLAQCQTNKSTSTYVEVTTPRQAGKTDDLVVDLAKPGDFPATQVIDGCERVRCRDAERDSNTAVADARG